MKILTSCLAIFVIQLAITIYLPAAHAMAGDLQLSARQIPWILSAYLLGMATFMLFWGGLSDRLGERRAMAVALLIFTLSSFVIPQTESADGLMVLRFMQGMGGGGVSVIARTLLRNQYRGAELAKAMSYFSMCFVIALGLGQFIGAYILTYWGWAAIFYGLGGGALLALSSVLVLTDLVTNKENTRPAVKPRALQNYQALLRNQTYLQAVFIGGLSYSTIVAFNSLAPIIYTLKFDWSAKAYGWLGIPISGFYFLGAWFLNRRISRLGQFNLLKIGILFIGLGALIMLLGSLVGGQVEVWLYHGYFLVIFGQAMNYPISLSIASSRTTIAGGTVMALSGLTHQCIAALVGVLVGLISYRATYALPLIMLFLALTLWVLLQKLLAGVLRQAD